MIEIVDTNPVIEECDYPGCNGTGATGDVYCPRCDGDWILTFDRSALFTLAHNLSVAGALYAAFRCGRFYEMSKRIDERMRGI